MPAYWAQLEGMSSADAMKWASSNGVSLSVTTIKSTDAGYDRSSEGLVVSQSPRYGSLISEYKSGSITVMGPAQIDPNKQVPDFIEHSYSRAKEWAKEHNIPYSIDFNTDVEGKVGDVVKQEPAAGTSIDKVEKLKLVVKAGYQDISFNANGHGTAPGTISIKTGDDAKTFPSMSDVSEGGKTYVFQGWYTSPGSDGKRVYNSDEVSGNATVYAHWAEQHDHQWTTVTEATCTESGVQKCSICGSERNTDSLGHDYQLTDSKAATTEADGYETYTCSRCGDSYTNTIPRLEPEPVTDPATECANNGGTWDSEQSACVMP
jgi:uncharacterized repeat protein (TIGR02543 family)